MGRIDDKISEIEKYLEELEQIKVSEFEIYESDFKSRALYERYFERIVEAVTDLAFIFVKQKSIKIIDDLKIFDILFENNIIPLGLCERLKDARGMRNIISHEYGEIDNKLVFESINDELSKDIEDFLNELKESLRY